MNVLSLWVDQMSRSLPSPGEICHFFVTISSLPTANAYTVDVGGGLRETRTYEQLEADGWSIKFSLLGSGWRN